MAVATASFRGSKRCFFEEDDFVPSSLCPLLLKKIRRSPSSSYLLCCYKEPSAKTLTLCGTKRSLIEDDFVSSSSASLPKRIRPSHDDPSMKKNSAARDEDSSWVDLLVGEMLKATSVDDAKSRASRLLAGVLEEAVKGLPVENKKLKEQGEALVKENGTFKHAVVVLHHQKHRECQDENRELMQLNQLAKEKVKELELKNYELGLHLNQALQRSSFTDEKLPPHVF